MLFCRDCFVGSDLPLGLGGLLLQGHIILGAKANALIDGIRRHSLAEGANHNKVHKIKKSAACRGDALEIDLLLIPSCISESMR